MISGEVCSVHGRLFGFVDRTGDPVIKPQFDRAADFSDGMALVKSNGKYGFVNQKGELVIAPQFDGASSFQNGVARAVMGSRLGFIDKTGRFAPLQ